MKTRDVRDYTGLSFAALRSWPVLPALPALARQKLDNVQGRKTRSGPGARRKLDNVYGKKPGLGQGMMEYWSDGVIGAKPLRT
jgi:hypothetical protein